MSKPEVNITTEFLKSKLVSDLKQSIDIVFTIEINSETVAGLNQRAR